jgi:tRNA pseudouridine55 synthase
MDEQLEKLKTQEIILADKAKGITSFDVIRILRRKLNIKKMGHAGTLDPMATGLMIIGVNKGTKKLNDYLKLDKTYDAEILLGTQTDSGDMDGEILQEIELTGINEDDVKNVIESLKGTLSLPVPRFSAIKRQGKKLYEMARKGEEFEVPVREMVIHNATFKELVKTEGKFIIKASFDVASGTYIRSLAEETGRKLSVPATLCGLRRMTIGDFKVEDAIEVGYEFNNSSVQ